MAYYSYDSYFPKNKEILANIENISRLLDHLETMVRECDNEGNKTDS